MANTEKKKAGFLEEDEKFNLDELELKIHRTPKWRCPIGLCLVQDSVVADSWRYHWIQTKGTVPRTVSVLFRVWYHSLDLKDCFSRHQGMNRNSSILCFHFTTSFYPSELSLLIIRICFCFNCFFGSLFTPAWDLQIPCCHPHSCAHRRHCGLDKALLLLSLGDQQCFSTWPPQQQPTSGAGRRDKTYLSPLSLPVLILQYGANDLGFPWNLFSSNFLNIPTQFFIFQFLLGYQPLSGASNFQTQTTNLTNWKCSGKVMSCELRCGFKSLLHHSTCKPCDLEMLPEFPEPLFPQLQHHETDIYLAGLFGV